DQEISTHTEGMDIDLGGNNDWPKDFIIRDVFFKLSRELGTGWQNFVTFLPGWSSQGRARAVIEHAQEENRDVSGQIRSCLVTWSRECAEYVTKQHIFTALQKISSPYRWYGRCEDKPDGDTRVSLPSAFHLLHIHECSELCSGCHGRT
ncbi:hypothetical protein BaRGS_00006926, partial [Batillaria attramentaria]